MHDSMYLCKIGAGMSLFIIYVNNLLIIKHKLLT